MAKLFSMFVVLIAVQACLILYADPTYTSETPLWKFVMGINNSWNTLEFITAIVGIAAGVWLVGIAASSIFGFKTDFLVFAPAITGLVSIGVIFINLGRAMQDELISRVFTTCNLISPLTCSPVTFIIAITIGPVALFYVWTVIEWWRGKDF